MTEDQLDQAGIVLIDLLTVGASVYPPLAPSVPVITSVIKLTAAHLKAGLAAGEIVPDGQGGFVSKAWADDPRHAIGPDGNFVDKSL